MSASLISRRGLFRRDVTRHAHADAYRPPVAFRLSRSIAGRLARRCDHERASCQRRSQQMRKACTWKAGVREDERGYVAVGIRAAGRTPMRHSRAWTLVLCDY